jgi:methyltransferase (TIGR00027 family)
MAKHRIETRASQTAGYTCFSRACATREPDPRLRGSDILAEVILPPTARSILNFVPLRKFLIHGMFSPGIYEYGIARTNVMDIAFLEALDTDFLQSVLLGAGFDTWALRFAGRNHGTKTFKLDVATTQKPKIEILDKQRLTNPSKKVFVSIDFDREDIF